MSAGVKGSFPTKTPWRSWHTMEVVACPEVVAAGLGYRKALDWEGVSIMTRPK